MSDVVHGFFEAGEGPFELGVQREVLSFPENLRGVHVCGRGNLAVVCGASPGGDARRDGGGKCGAQQGCDAQRQRAG